ncbi:MAG: alpha/beta hydrolase [Sandaracinaceae bacterium]|nr:alpha/beta hydrolase [Sandaracinaceae bacterium]
MHGNPGSMLDLAALLSPLSEMGSVAAYDAPGFGRSPTPAKESALTIDASAELAVRMLDHLGWPDAVIVGHSHGGGVAQRVARRWPERVRGLVLLGTLGAPAHLTYRLFPLPGVETVLAGAGWLLPRLPRASARRLVRYFMDLNYAPSQAAPEEVAHEHELLCDNPHVLRNMARVTRGEPCVLLDDDAPQIAAPTLFLHGERDQIVPLRHARRIYERMTEAGRRARFVAIPHAGHMLAAQEPGRCVEAIRELLTT